MFLIFLMTGWVISSESGAPRRKVEHTVHTCTFQDEAVHLILTLIKSKFCFILGSTCVDTVCSVPLRGAPLSEGITLSNPCL